LPDHEVFLLANHGVTALGASLDAALHRLESCEQAARILLGAHLLGGATPLPPGEAEALAALRAHTSHAPAAVHPESIV
jgi:L-fuculose-phosphate aldolase